MSRGKKEGDIAEYPEPEEMTRLLDVVAGNLYYTALYKTLKFSGRRIGEIYGVYRPKSKTWTGGIQAKDVYFKTDQFTTKILKTKKRKLRVHCEPCNKDFSYKFKFCPGCSIKLPEIDKSQLKYSVAKELTVSMRPELKSILEIYFKETKPSPTTYLFRETPLSTIKKKIKVHAKAAGIKKNISLHSFRKYFITRCKIAGMSNEDIAKWTGHVRPETVNIYDSRISEDVRNQVEAVDL